MIFESGEDNDYTTILIRRKFTQAQVLVAKLADIEIMENLQPSGVLQTFFFQSSFVSKPSGKIFPSLRKNGTYKKSSFLSSLSHHLVILQKTSDGLTPFSGVLPEKAPKQRRTKI